MVKVLNRAVLNARRKEVGLEHKRCWIYLTEIDNVSPFSHVGVDIFGSLACIHKAPKEDLQVKGKI